MVQKWRVKLYENQMHQFLYPEYKEVKLIDLFRQVHESTKAYERSRHQFNELKHEADDLETDLKITRNILKSTVKKKADVDIRQGLKREARRQAIIKTARNKRKKPSPKVLAKVDILTITEEYLVEQISNLEGRVLKLEAQRDISIFQAQLKKERYEKLHDDYWKRLASAVARYDLYQEEVENELRGKVSKVQQEKNELKMEFVRAQSPLYRSLHPVTNLVLSFQDLCTTLNEVNKSINSNLIDLETLRKVVIELGIVPDRSVDKYQVLDSPEKQGLDYTMTFLEFCTIAGLAEAVSEITAICGRSGFSSGALKSNDYRLGAIAMVFKIQQLRNHFNQIYAGSGMNGFATEMVALGVKPVESRVIMQKVVREKGRLRFFDFVLYSPLFNICHENAIDSPLGPHLPVLAKIAI